jgi:hypothetical protein
VYTGLQVARRRGGGLGGGFTHLQGRLAGLLVFFCLPMKPPHLETTSNFTPVNRYLQPMPPKRTREGTQEGSPKEQRTEEGLPDCHGEVAGGPDAGPVQPDLSPSPGPVRLSPAYRNGIPEMTAESPVYSPKSPAYTSEETARELQTSVCRLATTAGVSDPCVYEDDIGGGGGGSGEGGAGGDVDAPSTFVITMVFKEKGWDPCLPETHHDYGKAISKEFYLFPVPPSVFTFARWLEEGAVTRGDAADDAVKFSAFGEQLRQLHTQFLKLAKAGTSSVAKVKIEVEPTPDHRRGVHKVEGKQVLGVSTRELSFDFVCVADLLSEGMPFHDDPEGLFAAFKTMCRALPPLEEWDALFGHTRGVHSKFTFDMTWPLEQLPGV